MTITITTVIYVIVGVLIGGLIGRGIACLQLEFFDRRFTCHRCLSRTQKLTGWEYKRNGGAHEVCPPEGTQIK